MDEAKDRLHSYRVYLLACQLFDDFWEDSEILGKDYRGRELVRQQVRSLDSVCANIEEGYGRGFNKEWPQHLKSRAAKHAKAKADTYDANICCHPKQLVLEPKCLTRSLVV